MIRYVSWYKDQRVEIEDTAPRVRLLLWPALRLEETQDPGPGGGRYLTLRLPSGAAPEVHLFALIELAFEHARTAWGLTREAWRRE